MIGQFGDRPVPDYIIPHFLKFEIKQLFLFLCINGSFQPIFLFLVWKIRLPLQ